MRRFQVGLAVLAFALLTPFGVQADDRQIAKEIVEKLQEKKQEGELQNFSIDLQVKEGAVYLKGRVRELEHQQVAIEIARHVEGVECVYNNLEIQEVDADSAVADAPARGVKSVLTKLNTMLSTGDREDTPVRQASHPRRSVEAQRDNSKQIAQEIVGRMREEMERGNLRGFGVDVEVNKGVVWLKGRVSSQEQQDLALKIAHQTEGVTRVVNKLTVKDHARPQPQPVAVAPAESERASDEIAEEVIGLLKKQQDRGVLKNFGIDVSVDEGVVWLSGRVTSKAQQQLVLDQARFVRGVKQVVNDIKVDAEATAAPPIAVASGEQQQAPALLATESAPAANAAPAAPAAQPVPFGYVPVQYVPVQPQTSQMPVPFAPARPASHNVQMQSASPVPMAGAGVGIAPARYDHPQLPGYAWPSYAPYPNYGAVTYPKQYSPSAWPYIGPFYPYPQVPLGWRKVTLEWDDGWWQLDFKSR
jgi:osmotically-inducible protein OsmY